MANIQIHELNPYSGALSSSDYLATDNGVNTTKISATDISDKAVSDLTPSISVLPVLVVTASSISSLPAVVSDANTTTDMVVINSVLSNPSAQTGDWTVDTSTAGQATISGTISGTTDITLYLMKSR